MIKEFFRGGEKVQNARRVQETLSEKSSLSRKDRTSLEEARRITRRHLLTKSLEVGIGATVLAGSATLKLHHLFLEETGWENFEANPSLASKIRTKIEEYENTHENEITPETLETISTFVMDLYKATFGFNIKTAKTLFTTNQQLKEIGLRENEDPAGIVPFLLFEDPSSPTNLRAQMAIIIYLGKDDNFDANLNRLSVIRGVFMHEFIHSQTEVTLKEKPSIENSTGGLSTAYRRGLKFVNEPQTGNEKGWFFDEINCQLLAEYLNDPTGKDDIFQKIVNSPIYDKSLNKDYLPGADLLRRIYKILGISPLEIAKYYYEGNPERLLENIDEQLFKKNITRKGEFSSVFLEPLVIGAALYTSVKQNLEYLDRVIDKLEPKRTSTRIH